MGRKEYLGKYLNDISIFKKILLSFVMVSILATGSYGVYRTITVINSAELRMQKKLDAMSQLAALSFSNPVWHLNKEAIREVGKAILQDSETGWIKIESTHAQELYQERKSGDSFKPQHLLTKTLPIYGVEEEQIGSVTIGVSNYYMNLELAADIRSFAISNLILVISQIFIITLLARNITSPLRELIKGIEEIASGNFGKRFKVNSKDEVGTLSHAFNLMTENLELMIQERGNALVRLEQANQALEQANQALEIKVSDRTEELAASKESAEKANKAKSTFLANISHELRTPLNVILGYSQLLQMDLSLTHDQRKDLSVINQNGENLLALINEVLEISRIEAGKLSLNLSTFNVHKLIHDLEVMFLIRAQQKGLRLTLVEDDNIPPYIVSDLGKMRQVLINLVSNAVKFTERGSISIRAGLSQEHDSTLEFEVIDTGLGIAESDLQDIFTPFKQSDAGIRSGGGTGLGLTICKEFAEIMGGDIEVESHLGEGSRFKAHFRIEIGQESDADDLKDDGHVIGLKEGQPSYKVLVVDDIEHNRKFLIRLLQRIGLETREAIDGQDAIKVYSEWLPDLVFMDLRMPVMDGYEAMQQIKATEYGKDAKFVVVTASVLDGDRKRIEEAPYTNGFLKKPVIANELYHVLESVAGIQLIWSDEKHEVKSEVDSKFIENWVIAASDDFKTAIRDAIERADMDAVVVLLNDYCDQEQVKNLLMSWVEQFQLDRLSNLFS